MIQKSIIILGILFTWSIIFGLLSLLLGLIIKGAIAVWVSIFI